MGKYATYLKRGTSHQFGSMAAPEAADWTLTSPSAGNYTVTRLIAIPPPATRWGARLRQAATAWSMTTPQAASPITGSAGSGVTYFGQIAWFDSNSLQLSPWSDVKSVVIT